MTQHPPLDQTSSDEVLIRAENGDVIRYDSTGLVLRLSDRVLEDIAERLRARGMLAEDTGALPTHQDEAQLPDSIDAWSVRRDGDWTYFTANLPGHLGPRGYKCKGHKDAIIAETQTPLLGLLAIGGPRAALGSDMRCDFPNHIFAPGDDIGAVGLDGESLATAVSDLHLLREMTHESLVAQSLLNDALNRQSALPLYFVRAETDGSPNALELGNGIAFKNLLQAITNLRSAAMSLGKQARILGVFLDFALEDVHSTAIEYRDAMIALMENISRKLSADGMPAPNFLSFFECGTPELAADNILEGQWELSWNHAAHDLTIVAPSYMLELDQDSRLTDSSKLLRAAISAEALAFLHNGARWYCPTLHLAEKNGSTIKVTAQCHGKLVLDESDPFNAGAHYGFALEGVDEDIAITSVEIDPKDAKSLIISCNKTICGPDPILRYASGRDTKDGAGFPANSGALRDEFTPLLHHDETAMKIELLRRWALPARLKIN